MPVGERGKLDHLERTEVGLALGLRRRAEPREIDAVEVVLRGFSSLHRGRPMQLVASRHAADREWRSGALRVGDLTGGSDLDRGHLGVVVGHVVTRGQDVVHRIVEILAERARGVVRIGARIGPRG